MRFYLFCFLLSACAGANTYHSPGPYQGGLLLGAGTYLQDISIETSNGKSMHFQGVFKRSAKGVQISGLSPFGNTVFRITDPLELKSEPKIEIFVKEMEPHQERFRAFYRGLRSLLLVDDKPGQKNPFVRERYSDGRPKILGSSPELALQVNEYDSQGRAEKLKITAPHWTARINLKEYHSQ
jgi:hypothetical protein